MRETRQRQRAALIAVFVGLTTLASAQNRGVDTVNSTGSTRTTGQRQYATPVTAANAAHAAVPLPRVYAPTRRRTATARYPWKRNIVTTIFWIGEKPTAANPTPNDKSSWIPGG